MRHILYVCFALFMGAIGLNSQTLSPGDLAIVGFNGDNPDEIAIVALTDLASGTEIKFTDSGWKLDNTFRANEGFMTLALTSNVACGTTILITPASFTAQNITTLVSVGDLTGSSIAFAATGDQLLVYQGDNSSPSFITAANFDGAGWSDAVSSNTSALPTGLTEGVNAVDFGEIDNGAYDCSTSSDNAANLLSAACNAANWNLSNSRVTMPNCNFDVTDCGGGGGGEGCGTLFFSEYIEGSDVNKCLEIYNPTGVAIDLAAGGYAIRLYSNGAASPTGTFNLSGTLAAGDVFVFCDDGADPEFLAVADQVTTSSLWNGDDAIELVNSSGTLDIFGSIDDDPGSRWESPNGNDTQNQTLVRNSNVFQGITVNPGIPGIGGFTTLETEWTEFGQDYVDDLGSHTFDGCPPPAVCSIDGVMMELSSGCNDNGTINIDDDFAMAKVIVKYTDAPDMGTLELTGDVFGNTSIPVGSLTGEMAQFEVMVTADGGPISVSAFFSADPACALLNPNAATAPEPCSTVPDCSYPFFSEYIEGSGNNKCLEIYNPTESDINLEDYQVRIFFNGNTSAGNTINFADGAVLPAGGTYVICSPGAGDEFLDLADEATGGNSWFNGDDAVVLVALALENGQDVNIDVIGQIGFDPGSQWSNGGVNTQNRTIRRMPFVTAGDNNGINAFDPSAEWEGLDINTEYGLGYHGSFCLDPDVPFGWNPFNIGCDGGNYAYDDGNGQWTLSSECYDPNSGQDDLTFAFQEKCGDVELSAKIESFNGLGQAGLMLRESTAPGSKYVWIYKTASTSVVKWAIRSTTNGVPQVQNKFAFNQKWLKIRRDGYVFSGYTSSNGVIWKKQFQSFVFMDDCLFAGPAMHSNVDFTTTTAVFSNVTFGGQAGMMQGEVGQTENTIQENIDRTGNATETLPDFSGNTAIQEVVLRPNPVENWLEVDLPQNFGAQIQLTIVDMNGKVIYTEQVENEISTLALDIAQLNLSQGTYMLNLKSENQNITKRFVKAQ
jgi:hypothetical protein